MVQSIRLREVSQTPGPASSLHPSEKKPNRYAERHAVVLKHFHRWQQSRDTPYSPVGIEEGR